MRPLTHKTLPLKPLAGTATSHFLKSAPLLVSDNPEWIPGPTNRYPEKEGILAIHTAQTFGVYSHNIFLYHLNKPGSSAELAITFENLAQQEIKVSCRAATGESPDNQPKDILAVGTRIAGSTLNNTLIDRVSPPITLPAYNGSSVDDRFSAVGPVATLMTFPWSHNHIREAYVRLNIQPPPTDPFLNYRLRVLYGNSNTNWNSISTQGGGYPIVWDLSKAHPRGSWAFNEVETKCVYQLQSRATDKTTFYNIDYKHQNQFTQTMSDDPGLRDSGFCVDNTSGYGALEIIKVVLENKDVCQRQVILGIQYRGVIDSPGYVAQGAVQFDKEDVCDSGYFNRTSALTSYAVIKKVSVPTGKSVIHYISHVLAGGSSGPAALIVEPV